MPEKLSKPCGCTGAFINPSNCRLPKIEEWVRMMWEEVHTDSKRMGDYDDGYETACESILKLLEEE